MRAHLGILFAALLGLAPAWPAGATDQAAVAASGIERPQVQSCPMPGQPMTLSQVSQADCCKGHKGVCGCRAGKIVCCDNSTSPSCTCHGDSGSEN